MVAVQLQKCIYSTKAFLSFRHLIWKIETETLLFLRPLFWVFRAGLNILQKEEDFVLGIFGVLLGRIPGF